MDYLSVEEARVRPGLRLVLTRDGPGPWSEAAKGFFDAKGVPFAAVEQVAGQEDPALLEWSGQTSAPAAALDDERPVSQLIDILLLAEHLAPEPRLLPSDPHEQVTVLGLFHELSGRDGFGWSRRLMMLDGNLARQPEGPGRDQTLHFCAKYGYTPEAARRAPSRVAQILRELGARLERQRQAGRSYLVGESLSAADVLWAAFAVLIDPLPQELCPMSKGLRRLYTVTDPDLLQALDPALLALRDFVYREHLRLPLDF